MARLPCGINWPGNVRAHRRRLPKPRRPWTGKQRVLPLIVVRPVRSLREIAGTRQVVRWSRPTHSRRAPALPIEGDHSMPWLHGWPLFHSPLAIHGTHCRRSLAPKQKLPAAGSWLTGGARAGEGIARSQPLAASGTPTEALAQCWMTASACAPTSSPSTTRPRAVRGTSGCSRKPVTS